MHILTFTLFSLVLIQNFLFIIRPSNVPEGAHVQWEIELLGFEMPKVKLLVLLNPKLKPRTNRRCPALALNVKFLIFNKQESDLYAKLKQALMDTIGMIKLIISCFITEF